MSTLEEKLERSKMPFTQVAGRAITFHEVLLYLPLRFFKDDLAEVLFRKLSVPRKIEVRQESVETLLWVSSLDLFIQSAEALGLIEKDLTSDRISLRSGHYWNTY